MPIARSLAQLPAYEETVALTDLGEGRGRLGLRARRRWRGVEEGEEADYAACVLGLRDYVNKNRFPGVVLGLSGGIDSRHLRRHGGRCARGRSACIA